jgi:uncharacterized protein YegJ (DUF2314 family)
MMEFRTLLSWMTDSYSGGTLLLSIALGDCARGFMKQSLLTPLCVILALTGCGSSEKPGGEIIRRDGQPDYTRLQGEDPEMAKAIQTARETVGTFIAALKNPTAKQTSFSIKNAFKDGEQVEHIWLSNPSFDGTKFSGRVDNEPVDVKNVKLGETAIAAEDEISDWFYVDNGKLVGGYTIRVLYGRMSPEEKKESNAHLGFKID